MSEVPCLLQERPLDGGEYPLAVQSLWNRLNSNDQAAPRNRFVFRLQILSGRLIGSCD